MALRALHFWFQTSTALGEILSITMVLLAVQGVLAIFFFGVRQRGGCAVWEEWGRVGQWGGGGPGRVGSVWWGAIWRGVFGGRGGVPGFSGILLRWADPYFFYFGRKGTERWGCFGMLSKMSGPVLRVLGWIGTLRTSPQKLSFKKKSISLPVLLRATTAWIYIYIWQLLRAEGNLSTEAGSNCLTWW